MSKEFYQTSKLLGLNDICIIPEDLTSIRSRKECNTYHENGMLPLFTAPMSCVIDENNYNEFLSKNIQTIIPRSVPLQTRIELSKTCFSAFGLSEFDELFTAPWNILDGKRYVCIDIANGHMKHVYELCKKAKTLYGNNIVIMAGNIANPETYNIIGLHYSDCVDYIRIGIGSGSCCTTSANTSIHYPMASLIRECHNKRLQHPEKNYPKIVADGGFRNFDQIIKVLALGADYVMLGNIFAKTEEACGETRITYDWNNPSALVYVDESEYYGYKEYVKYRKYYGMSTKKAQKEFGGNGTKTSEGIETTVYVEYSLEQWLDNFVSYLKSAMSYTDSKTLNDFIGYPKIGTMTNMAFNAYYK